MVLDIVSLTIVLIALAIFGIVLTVGLVIALSLFVTRALQILWGALRR